MTISRESRPGGNTKAAPTDPFAEDHVHRNGHNGHEPNGPNFRVQLEAIAAELGMRYTDLKATKIPQGSVARAGDRFAEVVTLGSYRPCGD